MAKLRWLRAATESNKMLCRRIMSAGWIVPGRQGLEMAQIRGKRALGGRRLGMRIRSRAGCALSSTAGAKEGATQGRADSVDGP